MTTLAIATAAINAAIASPSSYASPYRNGGCGRCYVYPSSAGGIQRDPRDAMTKTEAKANAALLRNAATAAGLRWLENVKGVYVGYDNNSGREHQLAEAIAASLKAAGIRCYFDVDAE